MKTFIVNAAKNAVTTFKKQEVSSKLMGKEWRMLSDDPSITGKYIFLKDGKLLLSVNGISSYSTWQMATESSIIMDEGVATCLYKVAHIDDNIVVLNLDGTDSYCFLINDNSQSLANPTLEDIRWYLYRNCHLDILSPQQKIVVEEERRKREDERKLREEERRRKIEAEAIGDETILKVIMYVFISICIGLLVIACFS